jgi:myo-inositol-1(or 4)-monophosphatase
VEYLDFAVETARAAGEILSHYASREKHVEFKGRANLVTVADKESEALIVNAIQNRFPDHSILAEESGAVDGREVGSSGGRWIVDPLDGTTNYAHQFPMYSVSIGFELDGVLRCGVVFDPVRNEMFSGNLGHGAWLNGEPITASSVDHLKHGLLLTGFPYGFRSRIEEALELFEGFLVRSQAVRRAGSAALDLCYVAMGRADGFWELDLNPWDTAAGIVILTEAGGRVSDFSGGEFAIDGKAILASNGRIHNEMIVAIASRSPNDDPPILPGTP